MTINKEFRTFFSKVGGTALTYAGKLGNQKHMTVIRDAFSILIPIVIAAGFATLLRTFVFGAGSQQTSILGWIGYATGDTINNPGNAGATFREGYAIQIISTLGNFTFYAVTQAFNSVIALYVAFAVAYLLAQSRGTQHPILNGFVGVAAFVTTTFGKPSLFQAEGMLSAIIVAILASEALTFLSKNNRLSIKMPDGVPPAVARSFAKLLPTLIVLLGAVALNIPFTLLAYFRKITPPSGNDVATFGFADAIYAGVQAPFVEFASQQNTGLSLAIIYVLGAVLLWFFGLHGTNILYGIFTPIYLIVLTNNQTGVSSAIFTGPTFDAFIWFGGAGSTLALVISLLVFARKGTLEREVAKLSIGPAIFNINEPVIYGLPVVLNVKWVIPFVLTPIILTIWTYLGFTWANITPTKVLIPWATPPIISGLLATGFDWKSIILSIINLATAFAIYLPFAILWTRKQIGGGKAASEAAATPAAPEVTTTPKARTKKEAQ